MSDYDWDGSKEDWDAFFSEPSRGNFTFWEMVIVIAICLCLATCTFVHAGEGDFMPPQRTDESPSWVEIVTALTAVGTVGLTALALYLKYRRRM